MAYNSHFLIYSEVTIKEMKIIFNGFGVEINRMPDHFRINVPSERGRILTVTEKDSSQDIQNAYFRAIKISESIMGRISLVGFCPTQIVQHLLTTELKCNGNGEFNVLRTYAIVSRDYLNPISEIDLGSKNYEAQLYLEEALNHYRLAIGATTKEEKIIQFYACLERISVEECSENIRKRCNLCKGEVDTGMKATRKYIQQILLTSGCLIENINKFLNARHKIAHGAGSRDSKFYSELEECLLKVQGHITNILLNRLNLKSVSSTFAMQDLPFIQLRVRRLANGDFDLRDKDIEVNIKMGVSEVPNQSAESKANMTLLAGLDFNNDSVFNSNFRKSFFLK